MIFTFCDECHAILQADGSGHFPYCAIVQREIDLLRQEISYMAPVPTQAGFDWGSLTVHAVERLRAPKLTPVPDAIVKLAQQSYEGIVNPQDPDGPRLHVLRHTFESEERAAEFIKHLKNAGLHTTPQTSTTIVVDPDNEGHGRTVAWKTGERRARKSKV